jgi:glycosyltransferase involved in cell wall biosynthesis
MKVLIYTEYFFPIQGGVQTIVWELAQGLAAWAPDKPEAERIEVTVVTRTLERTPGDGTLPFRLVRRPSLRELVRLLCGTDIVHLAGPAMLPLALSLALRKPVVVEHHGYHSICPKGNLLYGPDHCACPGHFMAGRYEKCIECISEDLRPWNSLRHVILTFPRRWLCQGVIANIAVSQHVAHRIMLPNTHTIYHGIDDLGPVARDGSGVGNHQIQIGYVGRLVSEKGLPLLLEASKRLEDAGFVFRLIFVGDGPDRSELEDLTRRLGLQARTRFLGELSGTGLEEAVRPLQVVVMPSLSEETVGLAAIEQMMRGGVVIAADIGGLGEVVGDAGLKFTTGDSNALYSCLRRVLENPALVTSLGAAGRARAMKVFHRDSMIRNHVSLYRDAVIR